MDNYDQLRNAIDVIEARIGNTPIVRLNSILDNNDFELYLKQENMNPSGSTKDRSALSILKNAYMEGKINKDTVIIESSSGNFGIALAMMCIQLGISFTCVVDERISNINYRLLKTYGANVIYIKSSDLKNGESLLHKRLDTVNEFLKNEPNSFHPNQYANIYNVRGHKETMKEIVNQMKEVDYIFCGVSTFGTIRGYAEYVKENSLNTKVIAVDAVGSVIFGGPLKPRLLPGHGAARIPELFKEGIVDDVVYVDDFECVKGCRHLLKNEGVLAGASTGGIITAIRKYSDKIEKGSRVVALMHDRGERYLDTVYSDSWVHIHFEK